MTLQFTEHQSTDFSVAHAVNFSLISSLQNNSVINVSDEIFNEWSWRSRNTIPTDLALLRLTARTYETLTVANVRRVPVVDQVRKHAVTRP